MEIVRTKDVCFGRPRINGTRLEIYNIISELFYAKSMSEVVDERNLSKTELLEVVNYCKELKCQNITKEYEKYCGNCLLSTLHENFQYKKIELKEIEQDLFQDQNNSDFSAIGEKEDIEEELYGRPGWKRAAEVYLKFW